MSVAGACTFPSTGGDVHTNRPPRPWYQPMRYASIVNEGATVVAYSVTVSPRWALVTSR